MKSAVATSISASDETPVASGLQTPDEKQRHEVGREASAFPSGLEAQPFQETENKIVEEAITPTPYQPPRKKYGIFPAAPTQDPGPPPDGGTVAWLQVLAAHLMWFISWGLITSFGLFQSTYMVMLDATPSTVSWIGTVQIFILLVLGTLSGRASDAGLVHEAVLVGTILIVFGLFMTSLCTEYYQIFLAQGICSGIGMGILSMPGLSVPASYFKAKKSLAVSIIASGAGTGGLVFPAMAQQLLPRVGFGWTVRAMAFVTLFVSILINLLVRVRIPPRRSGPLFDFHALKEPAYVFFSIGFFFVYWAVYFAFYYIDIYAATYASFNSVDSMNLLLILNALGVPGRIIPGWIAARFLGPLNTAIPTAASVAVVLYCWPAVRHSQGSLYGFAFAYGLVASGIQSLFAVSLTALTDDLSKLGTRMGLVVTIVAVASLTGSPIAGALLQASGGDYLPAQMWAASSMLLAAVALAAARICRTGWVLKVYV